MAADSLDAVQAITALIEARTAGRAACCVTGLNGTCAGQRVLVFADGTMQGSFGVVLDGRLRDAAAQSLLAGTSQVLDVDSYQFFLEPHLAQHQLIIVGAGHISVPLARLGRLLDFAVTVLDDREEFATAARFDEQVRVRRLDINDPFSKLDCGDRTYIVLVTRAHELDYDCLRALLSTGTSPAYIGMIGSRRRVRAAFHALLEDGVPSARLEKIHAPIGIEIGAETPAEIAVSIAAELIRERSRSTRDPRSIAEQERVLERFHGMGSNG